MKQANRRTNSELPQSFPRSPVRLAISFCQPLVCFVLTAFNYRLCGKFPTCPWKGAKHASTSQFAPLNSGVGKEGFRGPNSEPHSVHSLRSTAVRHSQGSYAFIFGVLPL